MGKDYGVDVLISRSMLDQAGLHLIYTCFTPDLYLLKDYGVDVLISRIMLDQAGATIYTCISRALHTVYSNNLHLFYTCFVKQVYTNQSKFVAY